ncbi:thiol-disulfide oxidoreductase DCC family protein [Achromobacter xylosoxidans]|uniref:thiol-disulfide oxidoreductase DCC family protein n=1 Tax=Achromobacter TaxID=222 RepID=UPI0011DCD281|nr:DUF393 domain-containing protein [Achromobacter xylosoxidans]
MKFSFSEISPWREFFLFLAVVLFWVGFCSISHIRRRVTVLIDRFLNFSRRRGAISELSLEADLRRIDLVRIVAGLLGCLRYGAICLSAIDGGEQFQLVWAAIGTLLSLLVMVGLFTPFAVFFLMGGANLLADNFLGASTLGTMVFSIVLLLCLLAPAGRTLSADRWLIKCDIPLLATLVSWQLSISGACSNNRLLWAKFVSLLAYFCVCLYSITWHLNDEAWTSGMVLAWVMLSPMAMPALAGTGWAIYEWSPWLYVNLTRLICIGMFAWYVLVLPGLFMGKWLRIYAIYWGLCFFLVSTFGLSLSYLGLYELLFWFALFAAGGVTGARPGAIAVLFDDRCNLCDRTVRLLARLDIFGRCEFLPIRRNLDFAHRHGVSLEQGLTDLIGIDTDASEAGRHAGYELYLLLSRRLLILWVFYPILLLGKWTGLGPRAYRWVADRRTRLFGVCEISSLPNRYTRLGRDVHLDVEVGNAGRQFRGDAFPLGVSLAVLLMAASFLVRLPVKGEHSVDGPLASASRSLFGAAPLGFGIGKINVFNAEDLSLFSYGMAVLEKEDIERSREGDASVADDVIYDLNDAERYSIIAQRRRMARMNLGCDRDGWEQIAPVLAAARRRDYFVSGDIMTVSIIKYPWPSPTSLRTYERVRQDAGAPLCTVDIDVETGALRKFQFEQEGVNRQLIQLGYELPLAPDMAEGAILYPFLSDGIFLRILAAAHAKLNSDNALRAAIVEAGADTRGRFALDHLVLIHRLSTRWPKLLKERLIVPSEQVCESGLALVRALVAVPRGVPDDLHAHLVQYEAAASAAWHSNNMAECTSVVLKARGLWWKRMTAFAS